MPQLISFTSFKGGAGKTTALMAAAGSFAEQGRRVALFEADENEPLGEWRRNALEIDTWDHACEIFPATELSSFEAAYEKAETEGFDFALVDTQGGGSELINTIVLSSDLIVIPTALTQIDLNAALDTLEYVVETFEANKSTGAGEAPAAILIQRLTTGRLSVSEKAHLDIMQSVPLFDARLHARNAFGDLSALGMLHLHADKLAANPAKRIGANHIRVAAREARAFTDDLLSSLLETA